MKPVGVATAPDDAEVSEPKNGALEVGGIVGGAAMSMGGKMGGELAVGESSHSRSGSLMTVQRPFLPVLRDQ